ncbi:MAG: DUF1549 domain-containing protein, partial [Planctomycetota bacterium]
MSQILCFHFGFRIFLCCTFGLVSHSSLSRLDGQQLEFNRDIRPILSDKCFACHGPDAEHAAGDLRLDLFELATQSGAIVPGDPQASELVARIISDDEFEVMPPPEAHKPLSEAERDTLQKWIQQGARYEKHWAYIPVQRQGSTNGQHFVDHFIEKQLKRSGLNPVGMADRITLIRRLAVDLTGIPPTTDQVETFLADRSPEAYMNLVDQFLQSPRYGERMAAYWLDLVRYADSVGYHGDQEISQWPFRDYVIQSFNQNLAYDQFIKEQLAGDLLPDPTR